MRRLVAAGAGILTAVVGWPVVAASAPLAADGAEHQIEVEALVGGGYDDNALRVQDGVDAPDGGYTNLGLIADYDYERRRFEWSPRFRGEAALYGSSLDHADTWEVVLDQPLTWIPYRQGRRKLEVEISPFYEESRRTFTRRATGEEFFDAGNQVSLGDRFNSRAYGATLKGRFQWRAWTYAELEVEALRRDYKEDFEAFPLIDSLDYDSLAVTPAASCAFTKRFSVGVEGRYRRKDYDEKIPFFSDGSEALVIVGGEIVPVEPQRYRYYGYGAWARYERSRHELKVRYARTRREDRFEEYLNWAEASWNVDWDLRASERVDLELDVDYERVRYPNAHVSFNPANPLRLDTELFARLEARILLVPGWRLVLALARDDEDSRNPIFNYDRNRFEAGIQYLFDRPAPAAR